MHQGNSPFDEQYTDGTYLPLKMTCIFLVVSSSMSHQTYFTIMLLMLVYKHLMEILNTVSS